VAQFTDQFCYKDWVIEKFGKDRDGDKKKRRHFVHVPAKQGRHTTPGRRHRADKEKKNTISPPGLLFVGLPRLFSRVHTLEQTNDQLASCGGLNRMGYQFPIFKTR
jgi:hypothetical protein